MNIKLYNTTSPKNKLQKSLNLIADINGESCEVLDEHNIMFVLSSGHIVGVQGSNYLYCTDTNKYYYIENYVIENQCIKITCKVDVLMTYRTQILTNTCTISRNETVANGYLIDNNYQVLAYKAVMTRNFPKSLDDFSYILMTVG